MVTMSEKTPAVKVGQVWKRKRDGRMVEVVRVVPGQWEWVDTDIHWRGVDKPGKSAIYESDFRKRYELHEDAPNA